MFSAGLSNLCITVGRLFYNLRHTLVSHHRHHRVNSIAYLPAPMFTCVQTCDDGRTLQTFLRPRLLPTTISNCKQVPSCPVLSCPVLSFPSSPISFSRTSPMRPPRKHQWKTTTHPSCPRGFARITLILSSTLKKNILSQQQGNPSPTHLFDPLLHELLLLLEPWVRPLPRVVRLAGGRTRGDNGSLLRIFG